MFTIPACPHPVSTTRPLPLTLIISAWSSSTSGSGAQAPSSQASCGGNPGSYPVVRATSPVTRTEPPSRKLGCASSITSNPASWSARLLTDGISCGSIPGSRTRRRRQKCGWIRTGMFGRPTARISPSIPVVWSKCPWLQTIASIEPGSMSRRRMFSTTPSGLVPASNSTRCSARFLRTVTSTENPCSAISESRVCSPAIIEDARCRCGGPGRLAGPWSGMNTSVTLSIRETISTESTGSSVIGCFTSTSWSTARIGAGGL